MTHWRTYKSDPSNWVDVACVFSLDMSKAADARRRVFLPCAAVVCDEGIAHATTIVGVVRDTVDSKVAAWGCTRRAFAKGQRA